MNIAFLASHGGSNMQAVIDACKAGRLDARPVVVICNNAGAPALDRAARAGIPGYHLCVGRRCPDEAALDREILATLRRHAADLIVLAGYMKKIGPTVLAAYRGRIVNIHPALLPRFGGRGMYGRHVHAAVLAAGERETGVTVHLIDENYDTGPILAQVTVPVRPDDTVDSLAARVLEREHVILSETLQRIVQGDIKLPAASGPAP
ncbi:MAG: phosphoribosylglycinamide formyltransferase [Opitutaceae bacterium]|nr:phosphoribosylglycinamide formyltransferase [Opitutaceae bacterium]